MALAIIILIHLIGWITSYPRHKKWIMEYKRTWTHGDCILALCVCFCVWPFIWISYFVARLFDSTILNPEGWWNRKSKF